MKGLPGSGCRLPEQLHRCGIRILMAAVLCLIPLPGFASHNNTSRIPAVRWDEQRPGCTFSRDDDGKYRYGLWTDELGIILAVDSQEMEKVRRRPENFFAALITVRYRGQKSLDLGVANISLEFVKHFHTVQTSLDPDDFSERVQSEADTLNDETAREARKHPEEKQKKEELVRGYLRDSAELLEFVGKNSLRPTRLSPSNTEVSGWVFFSTQSKWIGGWKKQEEFILRLPLNGMMFEFPSNCRRNQGKQSCGGESEKQASALRRHEALVGGHRARIGGHDFRYRGGARHAAHSDHTVHDLALGADSSEISLAQHGNRAPVVLHHVTGGFEAVRLASTE